MQQEKPIGNQPAFPLPSSNSLTQPEGINGLTKREWFTGMALKGLLSFHGASVSPVIDAPMAVAFADAVLTELEKKNL